MQSQIVSFDSHGIVSILDADVLAVVNGGGFFETEANLNGVCGGSEVNTSCRGSNSACLASPNTFCSSNQVCTEVDSPV